MNFITSSNTLLKHLQSISGVLSTSNNLPILDNFLFSIEGNVLTICASDLETTMLTKMDVTSEESGKIAIPAKLILDVLKSLPDQPCTFKVNTSNYAVEIVYDNGKSKMAGFNGEEFPKLPNVAYTASIDLTGDVLAKAINKTLFATGNDEMRPVMSGVYCHFSPENITFVATDAHKLVRYRRNDTKSDAAASFILPKKALTLLKASLGSDDSAVSLEYNSTSAFFRFGNINLICRLIDERYPDYEAVIPQSNPNKLTLDRSQFLNSLRRVVIFANKPLDMPDDEMAQNALQDYLDSMSIRPTIIIHRGHSYHLSIICQIRSSRNTVLFAIHRCRTLIDSSMYKSPSFLSWPDFQQVIEMENMFPILVKKHV